MKTNAQQRERAPFGHRYIFNRKNFQKILEGGTRGVHLFSSAWKNREQFDAVVDTLCRQVWNETR